MATRSLGQLTLDLILKLGGWAAGWDKAERDSRRRMAYLKKSANGISNAIGGIFTALGVGLSSKAVIQATIQNENALRQLEQRLQTTGNAAGVTSSEMIDLAASMQKVTTFGDEAVLEMQNLLLTFTNIRGGVWRDTVTTTLDLATALGMDATAAAQSLGRALNNPVSGMYRLSRMGIVFTDSQKEMIKQMVNAGDVAGAQNLILKELEGRYGGSATAAADTFGGALTQVKNAFGELLEAPGGLEDNKKAFQDLRDLLTDPETVRAAGILTGVIIDGFTAAARAVSGFIGLAEFIGESTARAVSGVDQTDIAGMLAEIEHGQRMLDDLELSRSRNDEIASEKIRERIAALREMITVERQRMEMVKRGNPSYTASFGQFVGPVQPMNLDTDDPDSEFGKIRDQLRQQIALYGKTGEAAKLRYQIENDLIEDIDQKQGEHLLSLAQQLDDLAQSAEDLKSIQDIDKASFDTLNTIRDRYKSQRDVVMESYALEDAAITHLLSRRLISADQHGQLMQQLAIDNARELNQIEFDRLENLVMTEAEQEQRRYAGELLRLQEARDKQLITEQEHFESIEKLAIEHRDRMAGIVVDETSIFAEQAARNLQDAFAQFFFDPFEEGLDGLLNNFTRIIQQMIGQAIAADFASMLGLPGAGKGGNVAGLAGALGKVFGGFFADGGRPDAHKISVVGESGPELFIPDGARGNVVPLRSGSNRGSVTQNIYVQGRVDNRTASQIANETARKQRIAGSRLGG